MRVLIVSEMSVPHAIGGGEARYALLARKLARTGARVTWLSMRQRDAAAYEWIDGVEHVHRGPRVAHPPTRSLVDKLRFMLSVVTHLLRHRYDVVDCQTYAPLPAAWLACRLRKMPLVATIHDTSSASAGAGDQWLSAGDRTLARAAERLIYTLGYTRVLTVSQAVADDLVTRMGVPRGRVSVVPNAIDVERIAAIPAHAHEADLVFVGRLIPHKHPEAFLHAAAMVDARRRTAGQVPLRLRIIGGGPLLETTRALAGQLGLGAQMLHLGEVAAHDDVIAQIKASSVLVLPSTREGFGLVLAEAMVCRTGVLAWSLPPVAETLGPELVDALVPPHDVQALALAIEQLLDDEGLRTRRVQAGWQRAQARFSAAAFVQGVLEVYRRAGAAP